MHSALLSLISARAALAGPRSGSGLGLWIVRGIADAHHGVARAENRPEGGARFVIELRAGPGGPPAARKPEVS